MFSVLGLEQARRWKELKQLSGMIWTLLLHDSGRPGNLAQLTLRTYANRDSSFSFIFRVSWYGRLNVWLELARHLLFSRLTKEPFKNWGLHPFRFFRSKKSMKDSSFQRFIPNLANEKTVPWAIDISPHSTSQIIKHASSYHIHLKPGFTLRDCWIVHSERPPEGSHWFLVTPSWMPPWLQLFSHILILCPLKSKKGMPNFIY